MEFEDLPSVFHDVTPIMQDDGLHPVCTIDYNPSFVVCMNYLRAMMRMDERSLRSLQLTCLCLGHNPANYTIWHFRRRCLAALSSYGSTKELSRETGGGCRTTFYKESLVHSDLLLTERLGGSNPKNYQIWYHRRCMLEFILLGLDDGFANKDDDGGYDENKNMDGDGKDVGCVGENESKVSEGRYQTDSVSGEDEKKTRRLEIATEELDYVEKVLWNDPKNYHAWSHRQWIIRTINDRTMWTDEVSYASSLIQEDVRNNSAWNHRYFAVRCGRTKKVGRSGVRGVVMGVRPPSKRALSEVEFAFFHGTLDLYNESAWKYLVGVVRETFYHAVEPELGKSDRQNSNNNDDCDDRDYPVESGREWTTRVEKALGNVIDLATEGVALESNSSDYNGGSDGDAEIKSGIINCDSDGDDKPLTSAALVTARIDLLEMLGDAQSLKRARQMAFLLVEIDPIRRGYWKRRADELKENAVASSNVGGGP